MGLESAQAVAHAQRHPFGASMVKTVSASMAASLNIRWAGG
jgi:hypothetical protein